MPRLPEYDPRPQHVKLLAAAEARGKKKGAKTLEDAFEEIAELRAIIAGLVEQQ